MRMNKFLLSAICILLASVFAAGLAIQAVVAPRIGKTISAGVLSIPSMLGQTAEDVLFDPWPMYESQDLFPFPEGYRDFVLQREDDRLSLLLNAYGLLGIVFDDEVIMESLRWNVDQDQDPKQLQLFLKEFPTTIDNGQIPAVLDFALSQTSPSSVSYLVWPPETYKITETEVYQSKTARSSVSYVVHPMEARQITEQQRQAALSNVKSDLAKCVRSVDWTENSLAELLFSFSAYFARRGITEFSSPLGELHLPFPYSSVQDLELELTDIDRAPWEILGDQVTVSPYTIQLITTPQQIVCLLELDNGCTIGLYYDIQLECYSGFGMSF